MKKGFVTIATGDITYYKQAACLLKSYRDWGKGAYPFAILCEEENEYTKLFDDVVVLENIRHSTIDKLSMYVSPYEESIFLDADIIILNNIDDLWNIFEQEQDLGIFGCTYPLDSKRGWFTQEGCGKYKEQVRFMVDMNGGIVYFRKSEMARSIFNTAKELVDEYDQFHFIRFEKPADEPVMALSMVLHDCHPVDYNYDQIIIPGMNDRITVDYQGNVYKGKTVINPKLIHFSNIRTKHFLYNYLRFLLYNNKKQIRKREYVIMRSRYLFIDGKFDILHYFGRLLRNHGMDNLVEMIKKIIH